MSDKKSRITEKVIDGTKYIVESVESEHATKTVKQTIERLIFSNLKSVLDEDNKK